MRASRSSAFYRCARCRTRFLVFGANIKPIEHRSRSRVAINGRLVAFLGRGDTELGPVLEIGPGGLSFQYIADRRLPEGSFMLGIFSKQNEARLANLPVTTVSDVPTGESAPFSNIGVRRRGLKFDGSSLRTRLKLRWISYRYGRCGSLPPS